jgi:hypothetical protein
MDVEDFLYNVMHENYSTEVEDGSLPVVRWFAITSSPPVWFRLLFRTIAKSVDVSSHLSMQISRLLSVLYVDCTRKKNFTGLQKLLDRFNDNGKVCADSFDPPGLRLTQINTQLFNRHHAALSSVATASGAIGQGRRRQQQRRRRRRASLCIGRRRLLLVFRRCRCRGIGK